MRRSGISDRRTHGLRRVTIDCLIQIPAHAVIDDNERELDNGQFHHCLGTRVFTGDNPRRTDCPRQERRHAARSPLAAGLPGGSRTGETPAQPQELPLLRRNAPRRVGLSGPATSPGVDLGELWRRVGKLVEEARGSANARGAFGRILARDATFAAPEPVLHLFTEAPWSSPHDLDPHRSEKVLDRHRRL